MKNTFSHSQTMRKMAESIIVVIDHNNIRGVGECAPRPYVTGESLDNVFSMLSQTKFKEILDGIDSMSFHSVVNVLKRLDVVKETSSMNGGCALEMAIFDWIGKKFKLPVSALLNKIYFDGRYIAEQPDFKTSQVLDLSLSVSEYIKNREPFHYLKIKVNTDLSFNINRVSEIRNTLGYDLPIILDANMAWDFHEAMKHISALNKYNIYYYEEPLSKGNFVDYAKLRNESGAKILLDESLCTFEDAQESLKIQACDAFNIRISKCGGLSRAVRLIKFARDNKLSFQIGAQVAEVGPLIAAGRHLRSIALDAITFEAGQPDFQFYDYLIDHMPLVDRSTNLAFSISEDGLGIELNDNYKKYIKKSGYWDSLDLSFHHE